MNNVIFSGNLVNDMQSNERDGKIYAYNKIGVYNGKDKEGNQRDSMFFDILVFGRDAEILCKQASKGTPVTVMGRLEEDRSEKDGKTYINKRIVCSNVMIGVKRETSQGNTTVDPFA
jgi:single-strand DNA-binding protein